MKTTSSKELTHSIHPLQISARRKTMAKALLWYKHSRNTIIIETQGISRDILSALDVASLPSLEEGLYTWEANLCLDSRTGVCVEWTESGHPKQNFRPPTPDDDWKFLREYTETVRQEGTKGSDGPYR